MVKCGDGCDKIRIEGGRWAVGKPNGPVVDVAMSGVVRIWTYDVESNRETIQSLSQRPECKGEQETELRTASTITDDDELPSDFAHSVGRCRGR
jgi:hypothetical protein